MTNSIRIAVTVAGGLALGACVIATNGSAPSGNGGRQAASAGESACMAAVNSQYGGKVDTVRVASSEYSEANSLVMVDAVGVRGGSTTERWRCLVSNDGNVADLSVAQ